MKMAARKLDFIFCKGRAPLERIIIKNQINPVCFFSIWAGNFGAGKTVFFLLRRCFFFERKWE
jgi:hypothetical protein